jgi:hypothetical protein
MHVLPFFISSSLRTGFNRSLTQNLTLTYRNRPRLPDTSRYIPSTSCLPQPSPSLLPQHALSPILHLFVTSDGLESVFNPKPDPDIPQQTTLARHFTLYQFYVMAGSNTEIRYGNCIVHTSCLNIHTHVTFTLHTSHFTLHTSHFTLHTLHFTLHTSHFTLHASHFTALTIAHHSCTLIKPSLSFSPQHARSSILHLFVTSDGLQSVLDSKPDPDIPQQTTLARHFTLYPIYILSPPTHHHHFYHNMHSLPFFISSSLPTG